MKVSDMVRFIENRGWSKERHNGGHMIFKNPSYTFPLIIPNHRGDLKSGIEWQIKRKLKAA